ncbi:MAG: hypothetical protein WA432_04695 [Candidatus Babeliaceae bacterium]
MKHILAAMLFIASINMRAMHNNEKTDPLKEIEATLLNCIQNAEKNYYNKKEGEKVCYTFYKQALNRLNGTGADRKQQRA